MSFFSKISSGASTAISEQAKKLPNRFLQGSGFQPMGAVTREPRQNTAEELINSINAYAKENPEIAEFAQHIKEMNPKHLGLAQDVIDLSRCQELINTNINLNQKTKTGQSIMGYILSKMPKVSQENPAAL